MSLTRRLDRLERAAPAARPGDDYFRKSGDTLGRLIELLPEKHRAGVAEWITLVAGGDDAEREHPYRRAGNDLITEALMVARGLAAFPPAEVVLRLVEQGRPTRGAPRGV